MKVLHLLLVGIVLIMPSARADDLGTWDMQINGGNLSSGYRYVYFYLDTASGELSACQAETKKVLCLNMRAGIKGNVPGTFKFVARPDADSKYYGAGVRASLINTMTRQVYLCVASDTFINNEITKAECSEFAAPILD